jgi:alkanesulfonate monooxygenase SsuD/methylene tetrahydromethanopterin reductase-like flavin-dependent oxidoreductase (luciferase family)
MGPPDLPVLECYSLLAGLAARTSTVNLAALVTANGLRNPAMLAKTVTTLDVISRGRAMLGIGAGWWGRECRSYGAPFGGSLRQLDRLEEALQIIGPMLRGEQPTFAGEWYRAKEPVSEPRARPYGTPIMIGGNGERRTLRLVAA